MRCGLIKDQKTRYLWKEKTNQGYCCGLIKDQKTRYYALNIGLDMNRCGLIKDQKTRYCNNKLYSEVYVVV